MVTASFIGGAVPFACVIFEYGIGSSRLEDCVGQEGRYTEISRLES